MGYLYDFGDSWDHQIILEKIYAPDENQKLPICIKGSRACPPEDCGDVWGYMDMLNTLSNPDHPEYADLLNWLEGEFDPEEFDISKVNQSIMDFFKP